MKRILLVPVLLVSFTLPAFSQQEIITSPVYDNIKYERELKPCKNPGQSENRNALINDVTEPGFMKQNQSIYMEPCFLQQTPTAYIMPNTGILSGYTNKLSFRKGEYKYGIFLLHTPTVAKK